MSKRNKYKAWQSAVTTAKDDPIRKKEVTAETNAIRFVSQFIRNVHPDDIVWDLSARAQYRKNKNFYWLEADDTVNTGLIHASFDQAENMFDIKFKEKPNGDFTLLHETRILSR